MNRKLTLAGMTGIALLIGCSGTAYKLGGDSQATENAGGSGGGAETGGVVGAQGGDPSSFGGNAGAGVAGGQVDGSVAGSQGGGSVGAGGVVENGGAPPALDAGLAGATGIGGSSAAGSAGIGGGASGPPQATPGITVMGTGGTSGAEFVGTWSGYVENGTFMSGSDALLLAISRANDTELDGKLTPGQGTGTVPSPSSYNAGGGGSPGTDVIEGYAYTAMNGKVTDSRLQFDIALNEVWSSYCSTLLPVPGTTTCSPLANADGSSAYTFSNGHCYATTASGTQQEVDCTLIAFCDLVSGACACDATHCFANTYTRRAHFDMALRSPYLDGSVIGLPNSNNVHFTQQ